MGAVPSLRAIHGSSRIEAGAQTYFWVGGAWFTVPAMVRELRFTSERGVDSYPLSPMQQGMLFHCLQGSSPGIDVEQVICELHEEINAARLEQAWRELIER